jgi:pimeloyl-ACP methyl ester carboxylesterase
MKIATAVVLAAALLVGKTAQADVREVKTTMVPGGGGLPIAVTTWGESTGPAILFIHGFLASTLNWEKQIKSDLGKSFNLAAVDMRGHGASVKPAAAADYAGFKPWADDVAAAIKAAGMTKPVLVAWSYGGFFVMDYIREYGTANLGGIVLVGSTAGLLKPPPPMEITPERQKQIDRNTSPNLETIIDWTNGYLGFLTSDGPLPPTELETIKISALLVPHYVRPFLRTKANDNSDLVSKVDVPVMLINGTRDNSVKMADAEAAAKAVKATLVPYQDMGTMTFWYAAERFNRDLAAFVAKTRKPAK